MDVIGEIRLSTWPSRCAQRNLMVPFEGPPLSLLNFCTYPRSHPSGPMHHAYPAADLSERGVIPNTDTQGR